MEAGYSIDVGCVNLQEEFGLGTEYALYKRIAAVRFLRKEFAVIAGPLLRWLGDSPVKVIATGGSITTYAGIHLHQEVYDRSRINNLKVKRRELAAVAKQLAKMDVKARKRVPGMILDRVYDLPAGLMIMTEFLNYFKFNRFYVSSNGLRAGILKHYAEKFRRRTVR
jgi:exopolyphosphatase/pppGpp-phosphohydrolase